MFRALYIGLLSLLATGCLAQTTLNQGLKQELNSIDAEDQKYRILIMRQMLTGAPSGYDSIARVVHLTPEQVGPYVSQRMLELDSVNIRRIARIITQYGYPGKTLVGEPTNEVALLVIQHSNRIPQYLPLIKKMAAKGEIPFYLYARMLDRQLMYEGKEQLYGTQGRSFGVPNAQTGQRENVSFIWPIQDAARVNQRRKKAGFDSTVEANAQRLGMKYKPMALAEARAIEQASAAKP
ncbi:DUF6624 domain-containing protein [Hymenobacter sp. DG25B]|uniref:DUF6624 domain-containing protein n=1 Tax=Hymenobacter sp. DG25B TaxID=1385664 RepID=UPI0006625D72|nr:DUF6624 domain-containing protein [Hymenobacter sp. DG25B]